MDAVKKVEEAKKEASAKEKILVEQEQAANAVQKAKEI